MMKIKSLLLILVMMVAFSLSACGKKTENEQNQLFTTEHDKQQYQSTEQEKELVHY